jgi:hypothetical protein
MTIVILVLKTDTYTYTLKVNVYNHVHVKLIKISTKTYVLLVILTVYVVKLLPLIVLNVTLANSYTKIVVLILVQMDITENTKSVIHVTILVRPVTVVLIVLVIAVITTDSSITTCVNSFVQLIQSVCTVMFKIEHVTNVLKIVDIVSNHVTLTLLVVKLSVNNVKNQNILLLKMITVSQPVQIPTITLTIHSKLVNLVPLHVIHVKILLLVILVEKDSVTYNLMLSLQMVLLYMVLVVTTAQKNTTEILLPWLVNHVMKTVELVTDHSNLNVILVIYQDITSNTLVNMNVHLTCMNLEIVIVYQITIVDVVNTVLPNVKPVSKVPIWIVEFVPKVSIDNQKMELMNTIPVCVLVQLDIMLKILEEFVSNVLIHVVLVLVLVMLIMMISMITNVLNVLVIMVSMITLVISHVQLKCIWKITYVNLVTLPVVNVPELCHTNVLLVVKVNILPKPTLVFPIVQMVPGKTKILTNVSLVKNHVKLVSDQTSIIVILVMKPLILKNTNVKIIVYLDTTQIQLNGNVNHVMPNVVNVVVHPTENVLLVVLKLPKLIYITDIVLLHVQ